MTADRGASPDGAWTIAWSKGGRASVVALRDDAITLRSTVASPPGSRIDGLAGATPLRVKVHGCKRQADGAFVIDGRAIDFTRATRAAVAALVPGVSTEAAGGAPPEGAADATPVEIGAAAGATRAARASHDGAPRGTVVLRAARAADVPEIVALIRDLAAFEKLEADVTFDEADLARSLFGEPRYAEVTLAEVNGDVAGFALFFHSFSTFLGKPGLHLEDLFVRPEHRGAGIGKRLLAHLARLAVDRGCGRLEWTVLDWNERAISFYRGLGAAPMDEWTTFRLTGPELTRLAALVTPS